MTYDRMKTEYLCYLMNRMQINAAGDDGYFKLCQYLLDTPFIPVLAMDNNRSSECRELRNQAPLPHDPSCGSILNDILPESGTMLELLIVLAEKIKYDLTLSQYDARPSDFFFEMLENVGIDYRNFEFDENVVKPILEMINIRQFQWDGEYSFFPLRNPHSDQRYEELIVQMNNYIEENYDIC